MEGTKRINDDISVYIEDQELIVNSYVIKCFSVMMIVYSVTFLLNLLGIFVIEQKLMLQANLSSLTIYFLRCLIYIAFVAVCRSIFKIVSGSLERAKLTAALEKARFEAENANKAKSQFLARVSHGIRTPINAVMRMNENSLGDFRDRILRAEEERDNPNGYIAPEARILVVDDYKMNLTVFKGLLKQTQIQIDEAESGDECLKSLKQSTYDLIFLDHMMPVMDGIETLHIIKEQKLCENVPVIMLTANAIVGDREKYLSEGFDDFLTKPIIPKSLDQMVLKYLPEKYIILESSAEDKGEPEIHGFCHLMSEIDLKQGLLFCGGNQEFYLELFRDFTSIPIQKELQNYLKAKDYKNYCIRVHGFKNSAYSMGAMEVGDLAFELEKLTKDGFPERMDEMQQSLFEAFDHICQKFQEFMEKA